MRTGGRSGQWRQLFLAVIFISMLIDSVLLAIVHANFIHDHGFDLSPPRSAARLVPP
jgi:hypothetical protein